MGSRSSWLRCKHYLIGLIGSQIVISLNTEKEKTYFTSKRVLTFHPAFSKISKLVHFHSGLNTAIPGFGTSIDASICIALRLVGKVSV